MAGNSETKGSPFSTGGGGWNFEVRVQTYIAMHIMTQDISMVYRIKEKKNFRKQKVYLMNDGSVNDSSGLLHNLWSCIFNQFSLSV